MNILITGMAGFIGYHMAKQLIDKGHLIVGVDNLNDYYDVNLKISRLESLGLIEDSNNNFWKTQNNEIIFYKNNIEIDNVVLDILDFYKIDIVIHLAAQPGVRYSIENPSKYIDSNINGFFKVIEACRSHKVKRLFFASSSSVYGLNKSLPFREGDYTDMPISLYGATKKANELMAFSYSHLYGIPTTGLRFFTVYGSYGRPDMAVFSFTKKMLNNELIEIYNNGNMSRDFTHVFDVVKSIELLMLNNSSKENYNIFNIGGSNPCKLVDFINTLSKVLGVLPNVKYMEMQPGDVVNTFSDTSKLANEIGFKPEIGLHEGLNEFAIWFRNFYKIK
jgi:UDP-glucuronate 4-epimerase